MGSRIRRNQVNDRKQIVRVGETLSAKKYASFVPETVG